jgi:hypothetical protein
MAQRPLIGTSPNQVSTNGMLGDLAFQDSNGAYIETIRGAVNLDKLDKEITDTAVDVFVYDTRKDSDGGAWRKRTQHTSWYNETLNTATRGSRREFPAVAVIVAETAKVTIYDGDDPDLPMWMVFNSTATRSFLGYTIDPRVTSIKAINAEICIGSSSELNEVNFLRDNSFRIGSTASWYTKNNISQRNVNFSSFSDIGLRTVAGGRYNIAMTVLPNAPIDSTTGLPIPTIAVATDGGVSVIKDDGTVSDLRRGGTSYTNSVQFTDNNSIMLVWGHASDAIRHINHYSYGDWQTDKTDYDQATGYHELPQFGSSALQSPLRSSASGIVSGVLVNLNSQNRMSAKWDDYGLKLADLNDSDRANGMVAHIRPEYNSGWMHGNCKGAFLSDTDATNVTGSELIPNPGNGNFTSTTDWQAKSSGGTVSVTGGNLRVNCSGNYHGVEVNTSNLPTLISGKQYVMTVDVAAVSAGTIRFGVVSGATYDGIGGDGIFSITFTSNGNMESIFIDTGTYGSSMYFELNSVNLREAEPDRSVNDNGLQVFGTITKSAVATGAELVGYSGWSTSNYLEQPPNTDMNVGTGNYYVMGWAKPTNNTTGYVWEYGQTLNTSGYTEMLYHQPTGSFKFYLNGQGDVTGAVTLNQWNHFVTMRTGGTMYMYINGRLVDTASNGTSLSNSNAKLRIGIRAYDINSPFYGQIALVRMGASAPSAEQIKKIYEDEKVLFQENAACTLYGSSDAVTALAYDDSTNLLYAGTSSGRSDFQGLRRINNTTTAVTTAISASNGLVAEQ